MIRRCGAPMKRRLHDQNLLAYYTKVSVARGIEKIFFIEMANQMGISNTNLHQCALSGCWLPVCGTKVIPGVIYRLQYIHDIGRPQVVLLERVRSCSAASMVENFSGNRGRGHLLL